MLWVLLNGKGPLNAMYILKFPALENKHFGANVIKIGLEIRNILYFIFYITVSMSAATLNI